MAQKQKDKKEPGGGYGERWSLPALYRTTNDVWVLHELDEYGDEFLRVLSKDEVREWQWRISERRSAELLKAA